MAECEDTTTSDAIAETRRKQQEKLTKVKDKVVPRTDHQTPDRTLGGQCTTTKRKARWTTRGYEQTLNGNEDVFSATSK